MTVKDLINILDSSTSFIKIATKEGDITIDLINSKATLKYISNEILNAEVTYIYPMQRAVRVKIKDSKK